MSESSEAIKKRAQYKAAFERERVVEYPVVDAFEVECGYEIDRDWLESCAWELACPLKVNPPNWQHGRVLYALARRQIEERNAEGVMVDIGTAKGFSACVLAKAMVDSGYSGSSLSILSIDVISTKLPVARNSVAELNGLKTIGEFVSPYLINGADVKFSGDGSIVELTKLDRSDTRVPLAFIDGKHVFDMVSWEYAAISRMQKSGDVIVFDDIQIPGIAKAVARVDRGLYAVQEFMILPNRGYAVAERL